MFLVDALPAGDALVLSGPEGRHAARVRRVTPGEAVVVSDGRGGLAQCTVAAMVGATVELSVDRRSVIERPDPRLVVVQALAKGERGELAVEMMTELGVDEVVPWSASRSVVRWQGERGERSLVRLQATAREAAKQSRRAWVPAVTALSDTAGVEARLRTASAALVLHESAVTPLTAVDLPAAGEIVIVVGPEGGISPAELELFRAAGGVPCRLGATVLRTSTAGAAALAVLCAQLGRWG